MRLWVIVNWRNVSEHAWRKIVSDVSKSNAVRLEVPLLAVCVGIATWHYECWSQEREYPKEG